MDDPQNSAITFKASEQRDMRKRKDMSPLRSDSKATNKAEILSSPPGGQKNIVNIGIRSWQLISHFQLHGKSVRDMRTITLLASMVKDRSLDR